MPSDESFTPYPPSPPGSAPEPISLPAEPRPVQAVVATTRAGTGPRGLPGAAWFFASFLVVSALIIWFLPLLVARWRAMEIQTEADAIYQKRRAELRADAEAADERLQALDRRAALVSLGFREVVRKVGPTVVNLTSYVPHKQALLKDGNDWQEATDPDTGQPVLIAGTGSGFIVEPGWVLTNYHVVGMAIRVRVTFASGQSVVVGEDRIKVDPLTDLAAISLPPSDRPRDDQQFKVQFADSKDTERGDLVLALGNPLGLKHSVTHGIISAKGRLLSPLDVAEVLQTDAPINKGNSGGPLFNCLGQLVGVNFAIASDTGFSQGIGFAIPSNIAKDVFQQLRDQGEVIRGYLGVKLEEVELTRDGAGLKHGAARVEFLEPNQPASSAGLKVGDVVVSYNDEPLSAINPVRHLRQLIMETKVGATAEMMVLRGQERQKLTVTVGKRPSDSRKRR